jgi:PQQ-dependent dehydrogenase (s-GDH family)
VRPLFTLLLLSTIPILSLNIVLFQPTYGQNNGTNDTNLYDNVTNNALTSTNSSGNNNNTIKTPSEKGFSSNILATNLSAPHNILYGPDGLLWITERIGKNITLVDPHNGSEINSISVPQVHQSGGQDGLLGMAFDPNFNNTHHIYVAYTYDADPSNELERLVKITRFTFDPSAGTISDPLDLINGLKGSIDHNSGRMVFGTDDKLYYTIGDQGHNQLSLYCMNIDAQKLPTAQEVTAENWTAYQGKVLRMNSDGSIPDDNPVIDGVQSHIFTYGHRNPQGLTVGEGGNLFVAEHGPNSDDEVNHLLPGGNYGWPYVSGYKDDKAYQFINWSSAGDKCGNLEYKPLDPPVDMVEITNESEFNVTNFVPPMITFYTVDSNYNFTDHNCGELAYICNPTVAPSSLDLYSSNFIPGWNNTFLMTSLKAGKIFQLHPGDNGTAFVKDPVELFHSENRYRDLAVSPDGSTLYVITDTSGPAQALDGGATMNLWNPGTLLEFKYVGQK